MPVDIRLRAGLQATVTIRQHEWRADEPLEAGGGDSGPTPGEMMLGALGSCMAITCKLVCRTQRLGFAGRGRQSPDYERFKGADYPQHDGGDLYVHEVRKALTFHGDLDDKQRRRLDDIAGKCPIHRLLSTPTYFVELALEEDAD